jgi:hypothetical protein
MPKRYKTTHQLKYIIMFKFWVRPRDITRPTRSPFGTYLQPHQPLLLIPATLFPFLSCVDTVQQCSQSHDTQNI